MALVNSSRNNGRGKRKKKTNLSHKKKHNSTTRQTYFKYYHQTKKLNKLLDENKCQIQNEQIAKRKAHAKVKANIEKTEHEICRIMYETNECSSEDDGYSSYESNESDDTVNTKQETLKLIAYVLKILDCWTTRNMNMKQIKDHIIVMNRLDGKQDAICWSDTKIRRFLEYNATELVFMILGLKSVLFCDNECGVMWDSSTKSIAQRINATQRTLNRNASALRDVTLNKNIRGCKLYFSEMLNGETEIDEQEYKAMENEINAQTDNDVIMWNGDENTNTHPRTQPLRRSSRKKKKVTYP
eukprot:1067460_1